MGSILTPVLLLAAWSLVVLALMGITRLPAMRRMGLSFRDARHTADLKVLPSAVRQVSDNYNHLMEQPTVFYALVFYVHLVGHADALNIQLAWAYFLLRLAHSAVQMIGNVVPLRFTVFSLASIVLAVIAAREIGALFGYS